MNRRLLQLGGIALLTAGLATGCASTSDSGQVYSKDQMRMAHVVEFGQVIAVKNVLMEGNRNELLTMGGTALGGLAGSNIGKGSGAVAGAIVGAIAGGLAAQSAQQSLNTKPALEITVKLDNGGKMLSIVQEADVPFSQGQRVRVLSGGGTTRVSPL